MSYKCEVCGLAVKGGQPLQRHTVYRAGPLRQVDREIPICPTCATDLADGIPLSELVARFRPTPSSPAPVRSVPAAGTRVFRPLTKEQGNA